MQLGFGQIRELDDERLTFARQLGVENIIIHTPEMRGDGYWEFRDLVKLRTRVEAAGLKLFAIENMPARFYDQVLVGLPGRDEQIENIQKCVRNMGRAGIHVLGYAFMPGWVWRTEYSPTGRGGAKVTKYDHDQVRNAPITEIGEIDDETMWANYAYFLKAVVPIAEEEGVMLALHPDDPPVPSIAGIARIFRSVEAFKRAIEIVPSPSNGIEFCQGTFAEMTSAAEVYEAIRYFGSRKKIAYVHFRNVRGTAFDFEETFIDEGKVDMLKAMRVYKEVDFDGVLIVDHTPTIVGDDHAPHMVRDKSWGYVGRAFAMGYMKALLKCANEE